MRRTVRVKVQLEVVLDDKHDGIPQSDKVMEEFMVAASKIPGAVEIKPGAKFDIGLDRISLSEMKRRTWGKKK